MPGRCPQPAARGGPSRPPSLELSSSSSWGRPCSPLQPPPRKQRWVLLGRAGTRFNLACMDAYLHCAGFDSVSFCKHFGTFGSQMTKSYRWRYPRRSPAQCASWRGAHCHPWPCLGKPWIAAQAWIQPRSQKQGWQGQPRGRHTLQLRESAEGSRQHRGHARRGAIGKNGGEWGAVPPFAPFIPKETLTARHDP